MEGVWTALAVDERYRGKGKHQEVLYCGVGLDGDPTEVEIGQERLPQRLGDKEALAANLEKRAHSFCLVSTRDLNRIHPKKRIAVILAGLLFREPVDRINGIKIYVDGELNDPSKGMIKIAVNRVTRIPRRLVHVYCGRHLDSHQPLTNLAHRAASYLLGLPEETLYSHERRKLLPVWQLEDPLHLDLSVDELRRYQIKSPVRALQAHLGL